MTTTHRVYTWEVLPKFGKNSNPVWFCAIKERVDDGEWKTIRKRMMVKTKVAMKAMEDIEYV